MLNQLLFCLFLCSRVSSEDVRDLGVSQVLNLAEDILEVRPVDVEVSDVTFYLFNRSGQYDLQTEELIIDPKKKTKFIIHGWIENHRRSWYRELTEEYLALGNFNVIQVDWERPARSSYLSSAINTKLVGYDVAQFIFQNQLELENIHIIGHSLGAHVAGFAGKKLIQLKNQKVYRITALDPARPYFLEVAAITPNERLSDFDAEIVDVIHTDAGFFGYELPIGTFDVYLNGGTRIQPGCLNDFQVNTLGDIIADSFCSHARSVKYFIESIRKGVIQCRICTTFTVAPCLGKKYAFHAEQVKTNFKGVCVGVTNPTRPFLNKEYKESLDQ